MYKIVLKKKAKKFIDKLPLNEKKGTCFPTVLYCVYVAAL